MTFKKLALVSAIACASMPAFAVESLDDAALSATTGQDGIEMNLTLAVSTNALVHDTDGIDAAYQASYGSAGAIVVSGMAINAGGVNVRIDAGDDSASTSATAPVLNINVELTSAFTISTGTIGVANSRRDDGAWGADGTITNVINNTDIVIGATDLNIQLGAAEPQGNMIAINATVTGGVTLNGFGITDATGGSTLTAGTIGATSLTILDNGGTDLTVDIGIDVDAAGLEIDINQLGSATGMDVRIVDQYLGSTSAGIIGDVEIQGLDLAGTLITISGK